MTTPTPTAAKPTPRSSSTTPTRGKLACVSCNPSGARPRAGTSIAGEEQTGRLGRRADPRLADQLYASRALSDDGQRLFFDSFEALVPRDTNGRQDVYEWERAGSRQACEERRRPLRRGSRRLPQPDLLRRRAPPTPNSSTPAPTGATSSSPPAPSLLPQDPGLIDIYDARVGGGFPPPQSSRAALRRRSLPEPARRRPTTRPRPARPSKARATCAKARRRSAAAQGQAQGHAERQDPLREEAQEPRKRQGPPPTGGRDDEARWLPSFVAAALALRAHRRRPRRGRLRLQDLDVDLHQGRRLPGDPGRLPSL